MVSCQRAGESGPVQVVLSHACVLFVEQDSSALHSGKFEWGIIPSLRPSPTRQIQRPILRMRAATTAYAAGWALPTFCSAWRC